MVMLVAAHQAARARPDRVTPAAAQARGLTRARAGVVVQARQAEAEDLTKVVTEAPAHHRQLLARRLPVQAGAAGMTLTEQPARAARAAAVEALNTLMAQARLVAQLTLAAVAAAVAAAEAAQAVAVQVIWR